MRSPPPRRPGSWSAEANRSPSASCRSRWAPWSSAWGWSGCSRRAPWGGVIPIVAEFCGIALFTASWWSLLLGESLLAATFGTVSGFFFSLGLLLLGIFHNWYGIAPADVSSAEEIFYIVWCCFFLALLVPFLRLPVIYPLTVFMVVTLLALAATSVSTASPDIQTAAGAATLATSFLLFWEWLNVTMTSVGMSKVPPLGRVLAG
jgi:hypothetical protein